jgi:hypothetical protein
LKAFLKSTYLLPNLDILLKGYKSLTFGFLSLLMACSSDQAAGHYIGDVIMRTDFEDVAGWGADVSAVTRERAHSGRFAIFVNASREFSLTYRLPLREASVHQIKAVNIEAWVYVPSGQANASLNVQVGSAAGIGGSSLYSEQFRLLDQVHEFGKWTKVQHTFVLPPGLAPESELRIFLWRNTSPEPVYLDDLLAKAQE